MALVERIQFYRQIEAQRGNPLVVYVTSQRTLIVPGGGSMNLGLMAPDSINELTDQIQAIDGEEHEAIDLLIESIGGDALTSWRLISLLRTSFKKVNVLVPHSAFSAATLLALGADEIVMGRYGCLGPIDPQITARKKDGTTQQFGYEDIVSFLDFVREEAGITEQQYLKDAFDRLCESVEPPTLGFAKRSSALSVSMGEKMLQMHMADPNKKSKAHDIATKLNKSFFSHGHALSRKDASDIGLNIIEPTEELEDLMWKVHEDFEAELKNRIPLDPLAEFCSDPLAASFIKSPPPLHLPPQIANNQQLALQILQGYINQQVGVQLPEIDIELKHAMMESSRLASEAYSKKRILIQRMPNMQFQVNLVPLANDWRKVAIPEAVEAPAPAEQEEAPAAPLAGM